MIGRQKVRVLSGMSYRLLFTFYALALIGAASSLPAQQKDVLFIAVDDLNDWVGHLGGHPQARTPNIDRLVARGMSFTNAHCAAPACNPSRTALMSGLRPWTTGVFMNEDPAHDVLKDTQTINRHFLVSGYRVLGGGKIYHGFKSEGRDDTWTEWKDRFTTDNAKVHNLNGLDKGHFDWGPLANQPQDMGDYKLTDWAIDALQKTPTDQPLFLAVGYVKPHLPWYVPQEYFDRFPLDSIQLPEVKEDDLDDIPPAGVRMAKPEGDHADVIKANQWKQGVQAYLATVSFLDDQVGRLLEGLEKSPRAANTVVVWWTDHGWALGEKQHWRKFALWNDTTRTCFAIAAPGVTTPASSSAAAVDYMSVYPTVCQLAGVPVPDHVKGPSLVPLLKDSAAAWDHVAICSHGRGNHAAIDAQWRYIRYENGSEELYDHRADPHEWTNRAAEPALSGIKTQLAQHLPSKQDEAQPTAGAKRGKGKGKAARKE